ncbi:LacI family DNA-binding transcriptional regulator [Thermoanaerobacter thermohydrosulfuricus]|uniref:Transcriptional regulator n=1 Tax=Thermoanaerobacter thermohydrosulfuricus WC1 TaxID=1198630 RepID=M8DRH1_THETY|nr:LacI family DNA-binding transcriptional regulator [Thermoanaerobacter thermohydrosulfuricus]EMT39121.1 Transcriptional regulator [Thermoanaerobacter thermohydrosulfuricus WC1]
MATIRDVAKLAGVSTATVSRVLNEQGGVNSETKQKVLDAIKKLNYKPNTIAKNFRQNKTDTIIVVIPDITNTFFSKILLGMQDVANANGYNVLLCNTNNDVEKELEYIRFTERRGADGIIFLTARVNYTNILELTKTCPVVVACEYIDNLDIPTVSINNFKAAYEATEYLIKLGHKKIAYINGPEGIVLSRDRLRGYKAALERYGIEIDEKLIFEGDFYYESGYKHAKQILENEATAVFTASDDMAAGFIRYCIDNNIKVPEEVSVVGFDNIKLASIIKPELTTIAQPMYEIGTTAMDMLIKLIKGEEVEKRNIVLEHQLIVRESCMPYEKNCVKSKGY